MQTAGIKMYVVICFMVLLVVTMAQDPCQIYKPFPRAAERLVDNTITDDQLTIINDRYIIDGWYGLRTRVLASGIAPETNHCGTQHPIYLEAPPERNVSVEQEIKACVRRYEDKCYIAVTVRAKYCGEDLFVYYLDNSPLSSSGYCLVRNEITGSAIPTFTVVPEVNITIENATKERLAYRFYCDFSPSEVEDLFYRSVWRIDGYFSYRSPVVFGNDTHLRHNLSLFEDQIKRSAGFDIYCEIQASYTQEGNLSSSYTTSKKRFIGINVLTPTIRIKEGTTGSIQIQAAAEIGCFGTRECDYAVTVQIPGPGKCQPSLDVETNCGVNIYDYGANAVHNITLAAGVVDQYGVSENSFEVTLQSHKIHASHIIWQNYTIVPRIQVIIEKNTTSIQSKRCTSTSDPWLRPFGIEWPQGLSMQVSGTYKLYYDEDTDTEVQLQTEVCSDEYVFPSGEAVCNCGMVARVGTTAYMISKCGNATYWVIDYVLCGDGIEALKVSKTNGFTYKVTFPTGVTVTVELFDRRSRNFRNDSSHIDIYIYPSVLDIGRSRGLCGKMLENGTVLFPHGSQNTNIFESWKVEDERNMFNESVLDRWPIFNSTRITCRCDAPVTDTPVNYISCDANNTVICRESSRYKDVTKRSCVNTFSRRRRSIPFLHPKKHSHKRHKREASWKGGWTEYKARQFCTDLFNKSAMVELCRHYVPGVDVESSFQICMGDIQLSGTTDFALSATTSVHTQCVHEVYVNPVLQTPKEDKPSVLEEVEQLDCHEECSEHGQCINGSCICYNGYIGDACEIPFNLPPSASEVEYDGHCDLKTQKCDDVSVFGGTFVGSHSARCRIIPLKMSIRGTVDESEPQTTIPTVASISEIVCPLPARSVTPSPVPHHQQTYTGYKISVSNNGAHYSEELSMVMYNSECMTCSKNGDDIQCLTSEKHCVTDYVCYYDSEQYISNQDYVCRVDASGPRWELIKQKTEEDNQIYIIIGVVCSVVVLIVAVVIIAVVCKKGWCKKSSRLVQRRRSSVVCPYDVHPAVGPYAVHYDNTVGTGTTIQKGSSENTYNTLTPKRNDGVYTSLK